MKLLLATILFFFSFDLIGQVPVYLKIREVNTAPLPKPPQANAGIDQAITLPTSSVSLAGSGISYNGTLTYLWAQSSGPSMATISTPTLASTNITGLTVAGTYVFTFVVTDTLGLQGTDNVEIVVNPEIFTPPIVSVDSTLHITLPDNDTTLVGSATGTIITYSWTQLSGPNTATIGSASSATTTVSNMIEGTYRFQLSVVDNHSLTGFNTVQVIVHPAIPPVNLPPIAKAGADQVINL